MRDRSVGMMSDVGWFLDFIESAAVGFLGGTFRYSNMPLTFK